MVCLTCLVMRPAHYCILYIDKTGVYKITAYININVRAIEVFTSISLSII